MTEDARLRVKGLLFHHFAKLRGDGYGQLVRLPPAQTNGLAGLAVEVYNEDALPAPRKADAQVRTCNGLGHAAFLVYAQA